tara:strand:+ start:384 stop:1289 length:906 start_codon:yes stop_codon:yes gene_type:complete
MDKIDTENAFSKIWDKLSSWGEAVILRLPNILLAIVIMIVFYFLAKLLSSVIRKILRKQLRDQSVRRIIVKLIYAVILMLGFFIALGVMDLDKALTSVLAGAGVVALAIGLALQGTLSNTFSGIMLSFLPRIRIGDYIETSEHAGFVHEISLRNLVLRRPDNNYVIMPNSKFIEEPFTNYSLALRSRIAVKCGIAYDSNLREVEKIVREAIAANFEQLENEKIEFFYTEFDHFSINFMVRFWVDFIKKSQMYEAQHNAIVVIKDAFDANGITIPFPIRTFDFNNPDNPLKIEIENRDSSND